VLLQNEKPQLSPLTRDKPTLGRYFRHQYVVCGSSIRRSWLYAYDQYCKLLHPLYKRLTVASLQLTINSSEIMVPLTSSENLLFGDLSGKAILDIGTGCGLLALLAKKLGAGYALGVDINASAITNAESNLRNNFSDCSGVEFRVSNLYQSVSSQFDIIVSNPPYFMESPHTSREFNYCGARLLQKMLRDGKRHLRPNGEIRILHPASTEPYVRALGEKYQYVVTSIDNVRTKEHQWLRVLLGHTMRPRLKIYTFVSHV
jgi:predicted RNA methylase